ncbi:Annexin [Dorcoceras hygrometricum]|uniref:Annexin n=1 Tax=Dorcoceras hygrometricum TaxID=472368 RepID=A0A2Z7BM12_9LAMI|nr:Annexin [Dorcoceras hygrometricum]
MNSAVDKMQAEEQTLISCKDKQKLMKNRSEEVEKINTRSTQLLKAFNCYRHSAAPGSDQFHEKTGTSNFRSREEPGDGGGGRRPAAMGGRRGREACGRGLAAMRASTCVTLNGSGIQLAVGTQPLWLRNHNFGLAQRIMVKRQATSCHDPLGITDSACKNQLVVVSVQYGPFYTYIPIRSTTIGKSRVAIDPIAMHTSWKSNSDIASVTSIGYPRMKASGESSTTKHRLLHASGPHPIPPPNDPNTCVTLNGSRIQLAVGPQPLWFRNHNFGLSQRIMVKRLATSLHATLGITDNACKNQLVVVSVQYGPFYTYIQIRSTTIGKSRVAIDPIAMHTSWRSNSDITSVTSIGYPRMKASGESSTTKHRLLHASGPHPIPPPNDPNRNPSVLISSGLLVQADEGVSLPVVDLIDESTAAYREEPVFL